MLDNQEFRDKALYGVTIEPLELALLTGQETLSLERSILGYQVLLLLTTTTTTTTGNASIFR